MMTALLLLIIAIPISAIWRGYVLSILWGWFAVPLFSLPQISIAACIGLTVIVGMFTSHLSNSTDKYDDANEKIGAALAMAALQPALALLIGWIVKGFM